MSVGDGSGGGKRELRHKNPHIITVAVLQKKPNKEDALLILKDIAHQVSYLMKEYKFKVGTLVEFYPKNKRLLGMNVNYGTKVMLRLRNPNDEFQFLSRESILGTMLHELTHNLFGPHDKKFYDKLDELNSRQWVFEQQGLFDTFLGHGRKLGGIGLRDYNKETVRQRRNQNKKYSRGKKLGTLDTPDSITNVKDKTPREMAAIAAERRQKDSRWCGDSHNTTIEIPSQEELLEVIIIDNEEDDYAHISISDHEKIPEVIDLT